MNEVPIVWMVAMFFALAAPIAWAEPWLCTDEYGNKAFSYEAESGTKKSCVHHPIPSSNVVRVMPRRSADDAASFPRVDAKTQKKRDLARRQILERELAEEQKSLEAAAQQLAEQKQVRRTPAESLKPYEDRVRLHQSNIENLRKELERNS
ncbi:MAG: hypothetical protein ACXW2L_09860 [Burkholderiales bacterium]